MAKKISTLKTQCLLFFLSNCKKYWNIEDIEKTIKRFNFLHLKKIALNGVNLTCQSFPLWHIMLCTFLYVFFIEIWHYLFQCGKLYFTKSLLDFDTISNLQYSKMVLLNTVAVITNNMHKFFYDMVGVSKQCQCSTSTLVAVIRRYIFEATWHLQTPVGHTHANTENMLR